MVNNYNIDGEIERELAHDFSKKSKNSKGLVWALLFIVLIILCLCISSYSKQKKYLGYPESIRFAEFNGRKVYFSDVKVVKIPQEVYDSARIDGAWSEFLYGDQKFLLFVYRDGCPYARAYENEISSAFSGNLSFDTIYTRRIIKVPKSYSLTCHSKYCPRMWIGRACSASFCIINPITKEILVDGSQNADQIPLLLDAFADWNDNKLSK